MAIIHKCSCKNSFQDENYGSGKRVMNKTSKGYSCTVCGKDHVVISSGKTPKK